MRGGRGRGGYLPRPIAYYMKNRMIKRGWAVFLAGIILLSGCHGKDEKKEIVLTGEQLPAGSTFRVSSSYGDVAEWKILDIKTENVRETWEERQEKYIDGPGNLEEVVEGSEYSDPEWVFLTIEAAETGESSWKEKKRSGYYESNGVWLVDVTKWRDEEQQDMLDCHGVCWCDQWYEVNGKSYMGYRMDEETGKQQFVIGFMVEEVNLENMRLSTSTGNTAGLMVELV